ncbi:C4-dicarboxylate ABC transporter permease [Sporanaerobium hydrogeniformans]|uniref:C4-dicarboxylate ABC transporter permease n=1 Tax=Sporanaerobium hydrogeniformans TaxID=3072179 RepID=A0AC61D878_9FIRM|nr:TRAP transporter small permease subunit [Sporanaerobium hydrogeniformans]PHV69423.1 C4-dicarboxylate ABC transporter permease [Sporanaerobium hydrogeniformans]
MLKLQKVIDTLTTVISSVLCGLMMTILVFNIIMRYMPGVGGVKWYMESSQYLNVWAMFIVGIAITAKNEHLRVNLAEDLAQKYPVLNKLQRILMALLSACFYLGIFYSGYILTTKAKQTISTMPKFKMAHVYSMIPITAALCVVSVIISLVVDLKYKNTHEKEETV